MKAVLTGKKPRILSFLIAGPYVAKEQKFTVTPPKIHHISLVNGEHISTGK